MKNYFTLSEFLKTDTGLPNYLALSSDRNAFSNIGNLRLVLNILRSLVGCSITITSGFRSPDVNKAVGGVANSYHLVGRAADITCSRMAMLKSLCADWHKKGIFVEYIYYPDKNVIHIAI